MLCVGLDLTFVLPKMYSVTDNSPQIYTTEATVGIVVLSIRGRATVYTVSGFPGVPCMFLLWRHALGPPIPGIPVRRQIKNPDFLLFSITYNRVIMMKCDHQHVSCKCAVTAHMQCSPPVHSMYVNCYVNNGTAPYYLRNCRDAGLFTSENDLSYETDCNSVGLFVQIHRSKKKKC